MGRSASLTLGRTMMGSAEARESVGEEVDDDEEEEEGEEEGREEEELWAAACLLIVACLRSLFLRFVVLLAVPGRLCG